MKRIRGSLLLGSVLLLAACSTQAPPPQAAGPGGPVALSPFDSCDALLDHLKDEASERVTAWGLEQTGILAAHEELAATDGTGSSADTGSRYSGTNNQVAGVDEADVVKTNGTLLVTSLSGQIHVIDVATEKVVSTIAAPVSYDSDELRPAEAQLLLDGDSLVILATEMGIRTAIMTVDLSVPERPRVTGTTRLEGSYTTARMIDGTIRLVMSTNPPGLTFTYPDDNSLTAEGRALAANQQVIAESTLDDWLPHQQPVDEDGYGGDTELLLECTDIGKPAQFSGFSVVSVVTFDADDAGSVTSAAGVLSAGDTVYASTDRVIVAASPMWWSLSTADPDDFATDLHSFDISDPDRTDYVASGRVDGQLLSQFAIDETDGVIRVTTTIDQMSTTDPTSSSLVILAEDGDRLTQTGRVDGLGETEQIYAVRYPTPDLAVVVTFRQTDPVYLIDTSDPTAPAMAGELKIPGYSAYLHPLSDGQMLGIGQDATGEGETTGLQVSLFDIADVRQPQRLAQLTWLDTQSQVEWEHKAFLLWQDRAYLPATTIDWPDIENRDSDSGQQDGILVIDIGEGAITEGPHIDTSGFGAPQASSIQRLLVIDDSLWALSMYQVFRFDLDTLDGGPVVTL
ncbi:MAG: beta-propeller domain-containing protein [Beutenbergiaceae bacterium]